MAKASISETDWLVALTTIAVREEQIAKLERRVAALTRLLDRCKGGKL